MIQKLPWIAFCLSIGVNASAQFETTPYNWNLPPLENSFGAEDQINSSGYSVMDFNGDGKPDLIDAQDQSINAVWNDGTISHWKVYINTGSGFSSTAQNWTLPFLENSFTAEDQVNGSNYSVMDFNGDGKPDLIDAQDHATNAVWNDGTISHWKVYLNTGSGFSGTAQTWTLPFLENSFTAEDQVNGSNYSVMDFNGDGKPDLIDAQDHTTNAVWNDGTISHWKVYLNTGSGFSGTAQTWTLPFLENSFTAEDQVNSTNYSVVDFNGDGKPDLIDAQDHTTNQAWNDGALRHWKVYMNTGTGFSSTAQTWILPYLETSFGNEDQVSNTNYSVVDFNGDGKPDLIDAQDHTSNQAWNDGTTSYWKVYMNTGTSFSGTPESWDLPYLETTFGGQDQVYNTNYGVLDFNGDGFIDLIDAQNHTSNVVWNDGTTSHWKVYLNSLEPDPASLVEIEDAIAVKVYPNPAVDVVHFEFDNTAPTEVSIYSLDGALLMNKTVNNTLITMSIRNLEAGVYVYKITKGENLEVGKFIKK